jgi:cation transport ATPase
MQLHGSIIALRRRGQPCRRGVVLQSVHGKIAINLDVVIFDKTGTLTRGSAGLSGVVASASNESDVLAKAAAVEATC